MSTTTRPKTAAEARKLARQMLRMGAMPAEVARAWGYPLATAKEMAAKQKQKERAKLIQMHEKTAAKLREKP